MALKITSSSWNSALAENRTQRDDARSRFFSTVGAKPVKSLRSVYVSPAARISKTMELLEIAAAPRISGEGLADAAQQSMELLIMTGLAVPSLASHFDSRSWGLSAFAPEVLNAFFETDEETSLEASLF